MSNLDPRLNELLRRVRDDYPEHTPDQVQQALDDIESRLHDKNLADLIIMYDEAVFRKGGSWIYLIHRIMEEISRKFIDVAGPDMLEEQKDDLQHLLEDLVGHADSTRKKIKIPESIELTLLALVHRLLPHDEGD